MQNKKVPAAGWIMEVESVSRNDLDVLRPLQVIRFKNYASWKLIFEWCVDMSRKHMSFTFSHQWGHNLFFYSLNNKKKEHHKPMRCSPDTFEHDRALRAERDEKTHEFIGRVLNGD